MENVIMLHFAYMQNITPIKNVAGYIQKKLKRKPSYIVYILLFDFIYSLYIE
jgi:hypothetical protein